MCVCVLICKQSCDCHEHFVVVFIVNWKLPEGLEDDDTLNSSNSSGRTDMDGEIPF